VRTFFIARIPPVFFLLGFPALGLDDPCERTYTARATRVPTAKGLNSLPWGICDSGKRM
jgi:hypothetical protein